MTAFDIYYWAAFLVSLFFLLKHPPNLSLMNNLAGSVLWSAFGFVLWPMFAVAYYKAAKREEK